MNAKTTTRTITSSIFLTKELEDDSAESLLSSTSPHGAQETTGQGSEIGTSKVSPQQPSQVLLLSA